MLATLKQRLVEALTRKPVEAVPALSAIAASAEESERTALAKLEGARTALEAAADAFTEHGTDENGRAVLAARESLSLAQLQADRTATQAVEARTALEHANARHTLEAAAERQAAALRVLTREKAAAENVALLLELSQLVTMIGERRGSAVESIAAKEEAHLAALEGLAVAEDDFAELAPDFAAALPSMRVLRREADIERRATVASYRSTIAPDVRLLAVLLPAIADACARIEAQHKAHVAAAEALEAPPLDVAHRGTHVLRALFEALPDDRKPHLVEAVEETIRKSFGIGTGFPAPINAVGAFVYMLGRHELNALHPRARPIEADVEAILSAATTTEAHRAHREADLAA